MIECLKEDEISKLKEIKEKYDTYKSCFILPFELESS